MSLWVVKRDASVGKPLNELEKIQVWVTLHGGQEDLEGYEAYGHAGLRRQKILRITEEIHDQNGVATQEDLARLLGTSIRTVRRDIAYVLQQGQPVVTRGVMPALKTGAGDQQRDGHLRRQFSVPVRFETYHELQRDQN